MSFLINDKSQRSKHRVRQSNISNICRIVNPAITTLKYMRHEPMKKLKPLCTTHTKKLSDGQNISKVGGPKSNDQVSFVYNPYLAYSVFTCDMSNLCGLQTDSSCFCSFCNTIKFLMPSKTLLGRRN